MLQAQTIKDIVISDFRAAAVFERHGIDFCCGGGISLEQACAEKGIDRKTLESELQQVLADPDLGQVRFERWEPDALVEHILTTHHRYVRSALPVIMAHTEKVAHVHGSRHKEVIDIAMIFRDVAAEMSAHMMKEEQILFPVIRTLSRAAREGAPPPQTQFGSIANPIRMMEAEHSSAGGAMETIRSLSGGYTPPDDACTTYRISFQELRQFEQDLHMHVHLENNILFPRALQLESQLLPSS